MWIYYLLGAIGALLLLFVAVLVYCFLKVFYSPKRKPLAEGEYEMPPGAEYEPFRETMIGWMKSVEKMPHEDVSITSHDGLKLVGKYYEYEKGAITEILFHGYRGNATRDMCAAVERCFALGRNALIVDQRASGESEGHVISFGINERRDCLRWVNFAIKHFGDDVKLILTGISMGGATVLLAAGEELPKNVVCILGDCPYSSAKEIIKKTIREMHLPPKLVYPLVKLSARIFGGFRLDETSPLIAVSKSRVPIILIHGESDGFVPCDMSRELYLEIKTKKKLVTVAGADHGLSYPVNKEGYLNALREFQAECGF